MKYNTSGLLVNAADNDFVKNNPVLCIYDGTQFIMLGSSSATNIRIDGAANHVVMISGQNTLVTSGRGIGIANGFATLDASGKLVQTAKNSDYATTAGIANTVLDGSIVTDSFNSAAIAPTAAKTSQALTIQLNGAAQPTFNGSTARTINITPASIGASTSGAVSDIIDGTTPVAKATQATQDASGNTITTSYASTLTTAGNNTVLKSKSGAVLSSLVIPYASDSGTSGTSSNIRAYNSNWSGSDGAVSAVYADAQKTYINLTASNAAGTAWPNVSCQRINGHALNMNLSGTDLSITW